MDVVREVKAAFNNFKLQSLEKKQEIILTTLAVTAITGLLMLPLVFLHPAFSVTVLAGMGIAAAVTLFKLSRPGPSPIQAGVQWVQKGEGWLYGAWEDAKRIVNS